MDFIGGDIRQVWYWSGGRERQRAAGEAEGCLPDQPISGDVR
jgi:hypothetical protein